MKKIILPLALTALTALAFTGCAGEEDDIFSATAAERLNESSAKYSARLEAQPNGWAMQYYPTYSDQYPQGSGYLILMDFNPDYSVRVAMDNRFSGNAYLSDVSGWEVIKDNGPVLSFNTFNKCMHAFSDPEDIPWTADENEQSEGCAGDYEFIIVDAPEDASYMMLKGKKRNTYNLLTPIEEGVDYQEYLADVKSFHNRIFPANALCGALMYFGDSIFRMDGASNGLPNIYLLGSDSIANEDFRPFLFTKRGDDYYIRFRDAFEKDYMEGELQELRYDSITTEFVGTGNPKFRISGYYPGWFVAEKMLASSKFQITNSSEKSEYMATVYDNMRNTLTDKLKYTISSTQLSINRNEPDVLKVDITYRVRRGTQYVTGHLIANYPFSYDEHTITIGEMTPDENTKNVMNDIPTLADFFNALTGKYNVEGSSSPYNLRNMRLTKEGNADHWLIINYV